MSKSFTHFVARISLAVPKHLYNGNFTKYWNYHGFLFVGGCISRLLIQSSRQKGITQ